MDAQKAAADAKKLKEENLGLAKENAKLVQVEAENKKLLTEVAGLKKGGDIDKLKSKGG